MDGEARKAVIDGEAGEARWVEQQTKDTGGHERREAEENTSENARREAEEQARKEAEEQAREEAEEQARK
jgi:colicin import membrane protein